MNSSVAAIWRSLSCHNIDDLVVVDLDILFWYWVSTLVLGVGLS